MQLQALATTMNNGETKATLQGVEGGGKMLAPQRGNLYSR